MNPENQTPEPTTPTTGVENPLSVMQPGEQVIFQVKRHPIGLIAAYVMSGFIIAALAVLAFLVVPAVVSGDQHQAAVRIGALLFVAITLCCLVFVWIVNKIYWGNSWILTSDSLTQVVQRSLFDKQSSQLSLGNLEDVTAQQDGILQHMLKYGVLRVETAGERSKFVFLFCPNPNSYAQQILRARESFEQDRRSGADQQPTPPSVQPPTGYPPETQDSNPDPGVNIDTDTE